MSLTPDEQIFRKTNLPEKILVFLKKKKGYVSGEEICRWLNISRQTFLEHIDDLRDAGYEIVAVPHLGYRMESWPDRLLPFEVEEGLNTKLIGRKIHYYQRCSSTMDVALRLVPDNPVEGTLILAETQTRGRGRFGRHWVSSKYKGLYFSLMLKPGIPPSETAALTLLSAVAVCEAVKVITGITCSIKWPNDILVHKRKLGGILTELEAELDRVNFVIIGVGLNVNNSAYELLKTAVSLKTAVRGDQKINRVELLQEILRRFEDNYFIFQKNGSAPILDKWKSFNITLGQRVRIALARGHIEGKAVDIDADGGLLVRKDNGALEKFMSGDVAHLIRN